MTETNKNVTKRSMAVFECPKCSSTITASHPDGLSELVILCKCNQNFPRMEHKRGDLERRDDTDTERFEGETHE